MMNFVLKMLDVLSGSIMPANVQDYDGKMGGE